MIITKKNITALLAASVMALSSTFALPGVFNDKLSSEESAKLENKETVIKSIKSVKDFSITSDNSGVQLLQQTVRDLKPAYLAEIIQVLPYEGNEDLISRISDMIMDIPSYAGIPYYSERNKTWYDLYSSAVITSTNDTADGKQMTADLFMEPFGNINTKIDSKQLPDAFYYVSTNLNTLKYEGFTCVKPEKMKSIITIFRDGDSWVLYGVGAVNAPSIFFLRDRVETSFMNRIKSFCQYFFTKL
ncbi:MAG TPA: hypothetical protein DCM57_06010 [Treponema sp.]|jgi:hypothetical protein|nr:hypothetical protein [Treponema sp.]HBB43595.1 hypothetical protein [Treponema sp.]